MQTKSISSVSIFLVVTYTIAMIFYYPVLSLGATKSFYGIPFLSQTIENDRPCSWFWRILLRLVINLSFVTIALSGVNLASFQSFVGGIIGSVLILSTTYCIIEYYKTSQEKPYFPIFVYWFFGILISVICCCAIYQDLQSMYNKEHVHQ